MNTQKPQIDFEEIRRDMDDTTELLDLADIHKNLGFTKDQVRFINLTIVNALKQYHAMLFPESK